MFSLQPGPLGCVIRFLQLSRRALHGSFDLWTPICNCCFACVGAWLALFILIH
jgi:hypothetical protein